MLSWESSWGAILEALVRAADFLPSTVPERSRNNHDGARAEAPEMLHKPLSLLASPGVSLCRKRPLTSPRARAYVPLGSLRF